MKKLDKKNKILLIEDNRLLREGISAMLKQQDDMHVVAKIGDGDNILTIMDKLNPDVVLIDLGLRSQNSLQVVKLITINFEKTKIIVMDLIPLQADVLDYVQAGVSGFILKDANSNDFFKTIRSVYEGVQVLPSDLTGSLFSQIVDQSLNEDKPSKVLNTVRMTKRERQVVELIADGSTNKEIAQILHLSPLTVKSHVHNILEKLTLNSRVQIAKHAQSWDGN
ncbi:MAG: response regulator transcription factor [Bacteroidetes bacterium]|nr:response regulator transcription factor [Bacteroidota bacterium]MBU1114190.1 response regulator transcription factor [Bacteroidota bacterium]MBU1796952.1 response regulator transcription factor [Bacteroidota bacterium]